MYINSGFFSPEHLNLSNIFELQMKKHLPNTKIINLWEGKKNI